MCVLSHSEVSDSLWPHRLLPATVLWLWDFQASILEWVAISSSRGFFWPSDQICVSCNGRKILYHWATLDKVWYFHSLIITLWNMFSFITNFHWRNLMHRETSILPRFTAYKWGKLYLDPGTQILVAVPKFISYGKRPQSLFKGLRGKDSRRWGILEMAQDFQ